MREALRSGRRELTVVLRACRRLLRPDRGRTARSTRDRPFRGHRGEIAGTSGGQRGLRIDRKTALAALKGGAQVAF